MVRSRVRWTLFSHSQKRQGRDPMRPLTRANILRFLLLLYVVASLSYWAFGVSSSLDTWRNAERWVRVPFDFDSDSHRLTEVYPEGLAAGLTKGEIFKRLNGQPYQGLAKLQEERLSAHPGDIWSVETRRPDGSAHEVKVQLQPRSAENASFSLLLRLSILFFLTPLICLLTGYWVVLVKPREPNAWMLLVLLTFPEVVFLNPSMSIGWGLLLRATWYYILQMVGPLILPLFGLYFPERSRIDIKSPWLKWVVVGSGLLACFLFSITIYREYVVGVEEAWRIWAGTWLPKTVDTINLLCVLFYAIVIGEKLRSASTPDTERRMRLLCVGSGIGFGAILVFFVILPVFGIKPDVTKNFWMTYIGTALFMVAPLTFAYVVLVERAMDVRVLLRIGTKYLLARVTLWLLQMALIIAAGTHLFLTILQKRQPDSSDVMQIVVFIALVFLLRLGVSKRLEAWLDRKFFREAYDADQVLRDLSDQVRRFTDPEPLLKTVTKSVAETLHVPRVAVLLRGQDGFRLKEAIGFALPNDVVLATHSSTVRKLAQRTSAVRLHREEADGWYLLASATEQEILEQLGAEILLPMAGRGKLMGFMTLGPKKSDAAYSRNDLALLEMVASQTGLALEVSELARSLAQEAAQRERAHREIEIAREVQERLFPQELPSINGATLAGMCRPALGVGGDYYDVIALEDGRIGLAIADVSGKGISAALLMASLRASLRGATLDAPQDLAVLMGKVSHLVYEASASNRYATFFFGTYDPGSGRLQYVNAGHNPPLVMRENSQTLRLAAGGPVIGLLTDTYYEQHEIHLQPGDILVTYTDGISEAMSSADEEWGEERLEVAVRQTVGDAGSIVKQVFQAVDAFTAGAPQHDDMTLLVMKLSA
jgi:phosphoserine phosphatase RsbU/P